MCIGLAAVWQRSMHAQDSVQYITQAGTAYSLGTGPGVMTISSATRYTELLTGFDVVWLWSAAPGWSRQSFSYDAAYVPPAPTTQSSAPSRRQIMHVRPARWNQRALGFECTSSKARLPTGGAGSFSNSRFLTVPLWFLMLVTAAPAFLWLYFRFSE
jgi:hypothetical protein